jgi:hypothetical protein
MRMASDRSDKGTGASAGASPGRVSVPTAVVLWFDLRSESSQQMEARLKLEEKLGRERAEREAQKLRIKALQVEVASLLAVRA